MTDRLCVKHEALTCDELDRVAGGIIIVGGIQKLFTSPLDRVVINPQPLPPKILRLAF